ncbi:hypothetical protein SLEP1_g4576 [Rubroshorea leprosula]|uniref:CCHC-type domain-containing protein n=1 Tax=Rubroshorea leprosula TaxID=152421 RepID=A0AAV5HVJ3_9ROSI|nr:hypothetical protein SLEP1_g4576 [Rubroshorea leprosula]
MSPCPTTASILSTEPCPTTATIPSSSPSSPTTIKIPPTASLTPSTYRDKLVGHPHSIISQSFIPPPPQSPQNPANHSDARPPSPSPSTTVTPTTSISVNEASNHFPISHPSGENVLTISLTPEEKERLYQPWRHSVIVKPFGPPMEFAYVVQKLKQAWNFASDFDVIDLDKGFLLIKLSSEQDFSTIFKQGPWFIGGRFLSVRHWVPNFRPEMATPSTTAIWLRLPQLPIEFFTQDILQRIGNSLGSLLRIDATTLAGSRGRFARLCVEFNLQQPLPPSLVIDGFSQKIAYEGIQSLCFSCGRLGHKKHQCLSLLKVDGEIPPPPASTSPPDGQYGEWLIVTKKRHRQQSKLTSPPTASSLRTGDSSKGVIRNRIRNSNPSQAQRVLQAQHQPSASAPIPKILAKSKTQTTVLSKSNSSFPPATSYPPPPTRSQSAFYTSYLGFASCTFALLYAIQSCYP